MFVKQHIWIHMEHLQNCIYIYIYNISVKLSSWRQIQSGWWRSPATSTGRVPLAAWFGPLRIRMAEVGVKMRTWRFQTWTDELMNREISNMYCIHCLFPGFRWPAPEWIFFAKHGRMKPRVVGACHVGPMNQGISPSLDRRIKRVKRRLAPQHAPLLQLLQQQTFDFQIQTNIVIG